MEDLRGNACAISWRLSRDRRQDLLRQEAMVSQEWLGDVAVFA